MSILGPNASTGERFAFALGLDMSSVITKCSSRTEARTLPPGAVVGDRHGGLTFTDEVASVLESRSLSGWQEIESAPGETWTIIILSR